MTDPVVVKAVEILGIVCNKRAMHPLDKRKIVHVFRKLLERDHVYTVNEVSALARADGWQGHGYDNFTSIAAGVLDHRIFRNVKNHGMKRGLIQRLEREVAAEQAAAPKQQG